MTPRRVRRCLLAVAAIGVLSAGPGVALAADSPVVGKQATFAVQSAHIKRLTASVQMTKDDKGARAFTGPASMLADPANPRIIVAATAELRTKICYLLRSNDAGRTWHILPAVPALAAYANCTSGNAGTPVASLAWGRDHTLYYALEGYKTGEAAGSGGHGPASILLARSPNLGDSWSTTVVDDNRGRTGPIAPTDTGVTSLAVDSSGARDVVSVGFVQSYPMAPKDSPLQDGALDVAVSTNGGQTFDRPVNLDSFSHVTQTINGQSVPLITAKFFGAPFMAAHGGVIEVATSSATPNSVMLPGASTTYSPMPQLVSRSTDQGRTWSVTTLGPPVFTGTGAQTGMGWTPTGGPQGTFLAAYAGTSASATSSGSENIVVQRSTDAGKTWTDPVNLSDSKPDLQFTSFYPQLDVAPNGRVDVVFEDSRNQADYHFQAYYTYSTDGGTTWSHNVQVSDQPIDFSLGVSFNSDIRQPPGVASANQYAAFGWADTRRANASNQNQDDYGSLAQFAPIPASGSTVLPILASGFGGLGAAGLVILLVLAGRRRRERESPRPSEQGPVGAQ